MITAYRVAGKVKLGQHMVTVTRGQLTGQNSAPVNLI